MKKLMMAILAITLVGCSSDKVTLPDHDGRITDLERRMLLNEQLDAAQSVLIQANADAIAAEAQARISADQSLDASLQQEIADRAAGDAQLQSLLNDEATARQAGDDQLAADIQVEIANRIAGDQHSSQQLAAAVFAQSLTNVAVQVQLALVNSKITQLTNKTNSLQSQVNNTNANLTSLQNQVNSLNSSLSGLQANLQAQIDSLSIAQAATQAQLNAQGVQLFKCNSPSSTERIMKINGKFYAAMNRVTTKNITVVTGSSSQTVTTPDMCRKSDGSLSLPNAGGQCTPNSGPNASVLVPGTSTTVTSYSTAVVSVVDSVKIAIDPLVDGGYATTDGAAACSFTIGNGGTTSTGLVSAQ